MKRLLPHFYTISVALWVCLIVTLSAIAQDPKWDPPKVDPDPNNPTFGGILEKQYQGIIEQCKLGSLFFVKAKDANKAEAEALRSKKQDASAIPRLLQNEFRDAMSAPVVFQSEQSINRLFAFAYERKDFTSFPENNFFYKSDFYIDPRSMIPWETSNIVYSHDCASIVGASLDASAQYSLPFFSIKGAIQGSFSGNQKASLVLINGSFNSPFTDRLRNASSPERITALLRLWSWYKDLPTLSRDTPRFRLVSFKGATFYRILDQVRKDKETVGASAGLDYFVTVKTASSVETSKELTTKVSNWATAYAKSVDTSSWFEPLLTYGEVATMLSSDYKLAQFERQENLDTTIERTDQKIHYRRLNEVPVEYCKETLWTPQFDNALDIPGTLTLMPPNFVRNDKYRGEIGECTFGIKFTVAPTAFDKHKLDGTPITLTYSLRSAKIGNVEIALKADPISYYTSAYPVLVGSNSNPTVTIKDGGAAIRELIWDGFSLGVQEDALSIDWTTFPILFPTKIESAVSKRVITDFDMTPSLGVVNVLDNRKHVVPIRIFQRVQTSPDLDTDPNNNRFAERCQITGTIRFRKAGGGTVDRTFERSVDYPRVPPPAPTPEPKLPAAAASPTP